jgi:hypothetical protein
MLQEQEDLLYMPEAGTHQLAMSRQRSEASRVYTLNAEEVDNSKDLIQGTGLIKAKPVNILFDSGATHSFISVDRAKRIYFPMSKLPYKVLVSTPSEENICMTTMCSPVFLDFQARLSS